MNRRVVGAEYEDQAVRFLQKNGLWILEHNFRARFGEIDIIAKDGNYLVFIEVKYRRNMQKGAPTEAVNYKKQRIISKVSDYYRMMHHLSEFEPFRFDVISICGDKISWIKNAFDYCY